MARQLHEAEVKALEAEARSNHSEADVDDKIKVLRGIEVVRETLKRSFEESHDWHHGHFAFTDEVDELTVETFLSSLRQFSRMKPKEAIVIELKTPGGSIIDGFHMFDELLRLRKTGHHITIRVRGQAASMGGVILQAADRREMGANAFVMLHRASFLAIGKTYEIEDEVEFVRKLEARIVDIFSERSGKDRKVYEDFFKQRKDLWFSAQEAVAQGLVDAIV